MKSIEQVCEAVYAAFARFRRPAELLGCECCTNPAESARLLASPLRQLTDCDLSKYSRKAMTTWGSLQDFQYFLPRILELVATTDDSTLEVSAVVDKLAYASVATCDKKLRSTLTQYFRQLFFSVLKTYPHRHRSTDIAQGLLVCGGELQSITVDWLKSTCPEAALHLAEFVDDCLPEQRSEEIERSPVLQMLREFVLSEGTKLYLANTQLRAPFLDWQWQIEAADRKLHSP